MIKKYKQAITAIIIVLLILMFCLFAYVISECLDLHMYFGWEDVHINNSVSFKIPDSWESSKKNGLLYFYDNENNIVLFQSETNECFQIGEPIEINEDLAEKNICSDNFLSLVSLSSSVNSLGTISGEALVSFDGKSQIEEYIIFSDYDNEYVFYTYQRKLDNDILEKICDSVKFTEDS